jgi:hypothetical protein
MEFVVCLLLLLLIAPSVLRQGTGLGSLGSVFGRSKIHSFVYSAQTGSDARTVPCVMVIKASSTG